MAADYKPVRAAELASIKADWFRRGRTVDSHTVLRLVATIEEQGEEIHTLQEQVDDLQGYLPC